MHSGLEAVVFVGGVSLGQPATSIPIAAIVGILCGLIIGWVIYTFASRNGEFYSINQYLDSIDLSKIALRVFLIVITNFLLLIGASLFSHSVWYFQGNLFNHLLGEQQLPFVRLMAELFCVFRVFEYFFRFEHLLLGNERQWEWGLF